MENIRRPHFLNPLHKLNIAGVDAATLLHPQGTAAAHHHKTPSKRSLFAARLKSGVTFKQRAARSTATREALLGSHLGWTSFDFAGSFLCALFSTLVYGNFQGRAAVVPPSLCCALLFACCVTLLAHWSPVGDLRNGDGTTNELLQILKTITLANVAASGLISLLGGAPANPVALEVEVVLTFCLMTLARSYWRHRRLTWRRRGTAVRNFAVAGVTKESLQVCDYLSSLTYAGYHFKGFISLDDSEPVAGIDPASIIGRIDTVMPVARSMFIDEIFLIKRPATPALKKAIEEARAADIDLRLIPDMTETLNRPNDVHYIGDLPTIVLHRTSTQEIGRFFKRLIDIVGAGLALLLLSPLFLLLAIAIKWDSQGTVFYGSERVGLRQRVFRCFKFRTMVSNAHEMRAQLKHLNERDAVLFKIARDPRITRLGRILRKYSLDELPQLWNVLVGDMSLVGPRPPMGDEVVQYRIDHFCRLEVQPGITGLWQVEARTNPSFESYIELDRKYVNAWSLWLDLRILFRTASVVVRGTGT